MDKSTFKHISIRVPFLLLLTTCSHSIAKGQSSVGVEYNLLVGTYTKPGKSEGIYVYRFNSETGAFSYKSKAVGIENPSYLTVSNDHKHIYTVNEVGDGKGRASSFSFDPATSQLHFMNSTSSGGDGPCYITVDSENKYAFVGNYDGGNLSAIPIRPDGSFGSSIQSIRHDGKSIGQDQDRPHVHAAVLSPDNRFLFVPDLGTDKVNLYNVDLSVANPLTAASPAFISVKAGSGPRHFTFHPNGRFAYVIQELTGDVTAFEYENGNLKETQEVSLPSHTLGKIGADAADIHISPDGKFLYGSLRGNIHELVYYAIREDGKLMYTGRHSTLGKGPRNFAIDPTGKYLLVGNSGSNEIVIFQRNPQTGALVFTGKKIAVDTPVCLKFVAMD
jgi:6-phosphogluconolactonase